MTLINNVTDLIKLHEGFTPVAVPDDAVKPGKWSIGYGYDDAEPGQTMSRDVADQLFPHYLAIATGRAIADVGGPGVWEGIDPVRQAVLIDVAYEIGGAGLAGFHDMLVGVRSSDWAEAAHQLVDSKLYGEVKTREQMNVQMLLTGDWPTV